MLKNERENGQDSDQPPKPPTARELKELRALATRKGREENGRFLAEGVRVVEDLLESPLRPIWTLTSSTLEDSDRGRTLLHRLDQLGIPRRAVDDREFTRLADTESPQGVLAVAEIPRPSLEELELKEPPTVVLLLDAVQDPGNFGTMVRSAEALGAVAVIALPGTVDPWNPKSVRSAAGSSFRVPVLQLSLPEAVDRLRALGFRLLGAEMGGEPVGDSAHPRVALVVGNEGSGLSPDVRSAMDRFVAVPLRGRAESLNVAAAAAILLHELTSRA